MDTIKTYLDNAFAAFPQTQEIQALKRDMLAGMEEKYLHLRQQGQNEYEALGTVIANFGNIDELAAELGARPEMYAAPQNSQASYHHHAPWAAAETYPEDWLDTTYEEARDYITHHKKRSYKAGAGILLAFISAYACNFFGGTAGTMILIAGIAAAIPIVVINFKEMYYYRQFYHKNARLDQEAFDELSHDYARFIPIYLVKSVAALSLIILFLWAGYGQEDHNSLLLPMAGWALFLYLPPLLTKAAYDFFLGQWAFVFKSGAYVVHNQKKLTTDVTIFAVVNGMAGFLFAWWHSTGHNMTAVAWVVWPMAFIIACTITDILNWVYPEEVQGTAD